MNMVVVLNYNDWEETKRFCQAVKDFQSVDMIIIVDNKSTDNSVIELKPIATGKVVLVEARENNGYAAGNNVGLKYILDNHLEGNIIISNPDIYFSDEDLVRVLKPLEDHCVGISTGLITTDGKITSNFAWMLPSYWKLLSNQFLILYKIMRITGHSIYCDYPKGEEFVYCNCVSGCFFCMTTETLQEIGLFDERTFLYGEENILGFKIKENGQKVCVVTGIRVEHQQHHSVVKNRISRKRNERWTVNSMLVYVKYYLKKGVFYQRLFKWAFWLAYYEKIFWSFFIKKH